MFILAIRSGNCVKDSTRILKLHSFTIPSAKWKYMFYAHRCDIIIMVVHAQSAAGIVLSFVD